MFLADLGFALGLEAVNPSQPGASNPPNLANEDLESQTCLRGKRDLHQYFTIGRVNIEIKYS